jgi:hypothetical protein
MAFRLAQRINRRITELNNFDPNRKERKMNAAHDHDQVTIHIDKHEFKVANPVTGAMLYQIGGVGAGFALYEEIPGEGDDPKIVNDSTTYTLKNGEHFYSAKDELNPGK